VVSLFVRYLVSESPNQVSFSYTNVINIIAGPGTNLIAHSKRYQMDIICVANNNTIKDVACQTADNSKKLGAIDTLGACMPLI